jgi:hypothetical protein
MKLNICKRHVVLALFLFSISFSACYKSIGDAVFPDQAIYMPTAVNGTYFINTFAAPGQAYRYNVDVPGAKFNIPLSAYRSGLNSSGDVAVTINAKTDTVNTLISSGTLTNTFLLPADKYSLPASVTIPSNNVLGQFVLSIDLNYLLANITKSYAIAVSISSTPVKTTTKNTTVIVINPALLIPTANFSYVLDTTTPKQYNFSNTSVNSVSYSWNFGDGTPSVTDKAPSHVFASGTYTVTLTSTGAGGTTNSKPVTLVVP